jgi:thiamine-phosphate pyrophosphorylase
MSGVYLITDRRRSRGRTVEEVVEAAVAGGVRWVQIREKDLPTPTLTELVRNVLARSGPARVFVNDRVDVALATGCHGVHLGASTLPVAEVKRMAPSLAVGYSAHGLREALAAERDGAGYVTFSPIYSTRSKGAMTGAPQGVGMLAKVCSALEIPVYALGGITPSRVREALAAGAAGVAVVSAITEAADVEKASRGLVELFNLFQVERQERTP